MVKMSKLALAAVLALCIFQAAQAASGGIRSNRLNECSIWLCLPGGFGTGCGAARSAFIGRITDLTGRGKRRYTDLPDFSLCVDTAPGEAQVNANLAAQASVMTYRTESQAFIPAHRECTRLRSSSCHTSSCSGTSRRRCVAWKDVPQSVVPNTRCKVGSYRYDDYGNVIGSNSSPAWCTKTQTKTTVYGDGVKYGNSWVYDE